MSKSPALHAIAPHEKLSRGALRVLGAISIEGRQLAAQKREAVSDLIHAERVLIKRSRALLWLIRPALASPAYARVRVKLRKAAEVLAAQRDLVATRSTLEKLARKAPKAGEREAVAKTSRKLVGHPAAAQTEEKPLRRRLEKSVRILVQAVDELMHSAGHRDGWPSPSHRLEKSFHAMCKARKKAKSERDDDLHNWRKKTKRLLYQLELTQADPSRSVGRAIKRLDKLQEILGDYHDCAVVEKRLQSIQEAGEVQNLLEKRKFHLRMKAAKAADNLKQPSR